MEMWITLGAVIVVLWWAWAFETKEIDEEPEEFVIDRVKPLPPPRVKRLPVSKETAKYLDEKLGKSDKKEIKPVIEDSWAGLTDEILKDEVGHGDEE